MDTRRYRKGDWKKKHAIRKIELGDRIRTRRIALGLSQEELAEMVGLVRTSIVNIESGKQEPPITSLPEFLAALNTTAGRLLNNLDSH